MRIRADSSGRILISWPIDDAALFPAMERRDIRSRDGIEMGAFLIISTPPLPLHDHETPMLTAAFLIAVRRYLHTYILL